MKRIIFIDANIYLRFFDTKSNEFRKLLDVLKELKAEVFTPNQILCEINRNKLEVFSKSFGQYCKKFEIGKIDLPEHLMSATENKISEWNHKTKSLIKDVNDHHKALTAIYNNLAKLIAKGKDDVSMALEEVFSLSEHFSEVQLERARLRKELGNPPGKFSDPLGDQVNWEQLLDKIENATELWIITNDSDFLVKAANKFHLNPFLFNEVIVKNKSINIECFNTLYEGLAKLSQRGNTVVNSMPDRKTLNKIKEEEDIIKNNEMGAVLSGSSYVSGSSGSSGIAYFRNENEIIGTNDTISKAIARGVTGPTGPTGPYFLDNG